MNVKDATQVALICVSLALMVRVALFAYRAFQMAGQIDLLANSMLYLLTDGLAFGGLIVFLRAIYVRQQREHPPE